VAEDLHLDRQGLQLLQLVRVDVHIDADLTILAMTGLAADGEPMLPEYLAQRLGVCRGDVSAGDTSTYCHVIPPQRHLSRFGRRNLSAPRQRWRRPGYSRWFGPWVKSDSA